MPIDHAVRLELTPGDADDLLEVGLGLGTPAEMGLAVVPGVDANERH
jgi:hypothetical protein